MSLEKDLVRLKILLLELFALCLIFISLVGTLQDNGEDIEEQLPVFPNPSSPHVDKIVVIIVDAMRYDFIPQMSFVNKVLTESDTACVFKVHMNGPTVTLPRIKALVTGTTSSYWDFLANLKQSEGINSDSVILKAQQQGKTMVFYGDDTWLRLFPGNVFARAEGVSSFFVTDFYEVDTNVTRNMKKEMEQLNFDLMILHYLGVDHVGHVHGPKHALIPTKLQEMNEVLEHVYVRLKNAASDLPHVILLTGDHGMADQGGHGGDSYPEVTTPMILITVQPENVTARICKSAPTDWFQNPFRIKQTDIAATLAFLWDIPLPFKSRGVIPSEILSEFASQIRLTAFFKNSQQLAKFLKKDTHKKILSEFDSVTKTYFSVKNLTEDSAHLESQFQELLEVLKLNAVQETEHDIITLLSSILLLLVLIPFCFVNVFQMSDISVLLAIMGSFIIPHIFPNGPTIVQYLVFSLIYLICLSKYKMQLPAFEKATTPLIFLYLLFPFLFFSSSFVEEEHFFIYYLYSSCLFVSFSFHQNWNLIPILFLHRISSVLNATGQKWNNDSDLNDWLKDSGFENVICINAFIILILCFCTNTAQRISALVIALYKLKSFDVYLDVSWSHWEAKLCYLLISVCTLVPKNKLSISWILFSCVLQRPKNISLVALVSLQLKLISSIECRKTRGLLINLLFFASFYYQGNSNHITTIDISLGYTGLSEYNEVLVGILTFVSTFSLPILVFIFGTELQNGTGSDAQIRNQSIIMELLIMKTSATNLIYGLVVLFMRQHLFIWSVFIPKLLYLIGFTFLIAVLQVFILIKEYLSSVSFVKFYWKKTV